MDEVNKTQREMKTLDHLRTWFTLVINLEQINWVQMDTTITSNHNELHRFTFRGCSSHDATFSEHEVYLMTYTQGSGAVHVMVVENKRKRLLT